MPEVAKNYSITELEMCRLAMNIATFSHLLKKVDFDAVVDHLAITHIMRSKAEPATTRIKRLIELLSPYSFNLYYIKGKDMVLSDFLSRQKTDDSNSHKIIPISFSLKGQVGNHFYRINNEIVQPKTNKYLIQTRSQAKSSCIKVPEIPYREYFIQLGKRLEYLHKLLLDFRMKRLALIIKDRDDFQYNSGDLVYIISP